jgi:hypothetical protein
VRQRIQVAGIDGEHGVVLAGHPDSQRLGREPERRTVAVEGRAGDGGQAKLGFVGTVEDLLASLPVGILVRDSTAPLP